MAWYYILFINMHFSHILSMRLSPGAARQELSEVDLGSFRDVILCSSFNSHEHWVLNCEGK